MKVDLLNEPILGQMERYMDLSARRQSLVSSNLANIDTPGFRTLDIDVRKEIRSELGSDGPLKSSSRRHFSSESAKGSRPEVFEVADLTSRNDLNNVDLDKEMMKMSETEMTFSLFAYLMRSKFRLLQQTISEGK